MKKFDCERERRCNVGIVVVSRALMFLLLLCMSYVSAAALTLRGGGGGDNNSNNSNRQLQSKSKIQPPPVIVYNIPFALAFNFLNESLSESTCSVELNTVQNATYPIYEVDITTDSIMNSTYIEDLEDIPIGRGNNPACYALCTIRPRLWLIIAGWREECGLRRNLLDNTNDIYHPNTQESLSSIATARTMVNDVYYARIGTSTQLLPGQGDFSASTFYENVRLLIPISNECRNLMLGMTYKRIPLVVNL